jgi:hypothetical protein
MLRSGREQLCVDVGEGLELQRIAGGIYQELRCLARRYAAVRGDLLLRLERHDEARVEFERAASLTRNDRERALLMARAAACATLQIV